MSEEKTITCQKCGTKMVPSKRRRLDGSLPLDGSASLGNMICPKCHPEYVDTKQ